MPALMEDARTLWEFHQMHHELRDTDVAIGLGSHDIGVGTRRVLDMLVGDTQRLWVYADRGFAAPQQIDDDAYAAYERLVAAGYTGRLLESNARSIR